MDEMQRGKEEGVQEHVKSLVATDNDEGVPYHTTSRLFGDGLNFVPMAECWCQDVEGVEERDGEPVGSELDEEGAEEFDGLGWVACDEGGPS